MKIRIIGGEDPKEKPKTKVKVKSPSPAEIEAANILAKRLGAEHGAFNAESLNVGNKLPRFVDDAGRDITGAPQAPASKLPTKVPAYVKSLEWDDKQNLPYYTDEKTGYIQYVPKEMFYSARFNPQRGKTSIIDIAKR